MKRLYTAADLIEAHLLLHRLQHAGIAARVMNEHARGALGEIPFTHAFPEIWIEREADFERARALVTQHESQRAAGPARRCQQCGEDNPSTFEICWRCGAPIER